jgi:beta-lactam-binding protein with PASTA domain/tRNA A-37 threonylcarbamoyl transferase component Bud32
VTDSTIQTIRSLAGGRYEVGRLIGHGGMADVHVGTDTRLGRRVAIKLLKPALANDPVFRTRFRQEAQAAAKMAHPTIVRVFDAGEETVRDQHGTEMLVPFIVMEHVDGRMLKDIIAEAPFEPKEAARIISSVLTALEYSHRAGVVHRDIKPGNIMITPAGQVKVMDFGIARAISESSATVAQTTAILGTAQYFSPEQARGESVDARTDLYSTGVVLFELLTGRPPFRGNSPVAVAYQHLTEPAPPPSKYNPAVPHPMDFVTLHALRKDRGDRYQTAAEFRDDVEKAALGVTPMRPAEEEPPAQGFDTSIFGLTPTRAAAKEAVARQLTVDEDERVLRTQTRPPAAWIWAGIMMVAVVLAAVLIWVVTLPKPDVQLSNSIEVPEVTGMTWEEAEALLTERRLDPQQFTEANATVPAGEVVRTDPPGTGSRVSPGQPVQVWVSTGPQQVKLPRLSGKTESDARAALEEAGFKLGATYNRNSPDVPQGIVIRLRGSDVKIANGSLPEGSRVDLVVSTGRVTVPDLVGTPSQEANQLLTDAQLPVEVAFNSCTGGLVNWQSLTPGDHPQHSNITIEICTG